MKSFEEREKSRPEFSILGGDHNVQNETIEKKDATINKDEKWVLSPKEINRPSENFKMLTIQADNVGFEEYMPTDEVSKGKRLLYTLFTEQISNPFANPIISLVIFFIFYCVLGSSSNHFDIMHHGSLYCTRRFCFC